MRRFSTRTLVLTTALIFVALVAVYGWVYYNNYLIVPDYEALKVPGTALEGNPFVALNDGEQVVDKMALAAENEFLKLYVDEKTSFIAIYDKRSGTTTYSNPLDFESDPLANPANQKLVASQIEIEYYDLNRSKKKMSNYADAIENEQFTIEHIDKGIKITYTIGNLQKGIESLPQFITEARLQELVLDKVDAKMAKAVKKQYIDAGNKPGYLEMRGQVANSKIVLKQMLEAFELAGYSDEDLAFDNSQVGLEATADRVIFVIPVTYQLDEDQLIARINTEEVVDSSEGILATIRFLDFFGAGSGEDEGYLFVPNGSGALINFNNGKISQEGYYQQVYGLDPVVESRTQTQVAENVRFPVFGIKQNNQAFVARITSGDAIASITADIAGKRNNYNHIGVIFTVRDYELLSMFGSEGGDSELPVVEERMYQGDLEIAYMFMAGDEANYSGMATAYRARLIKEGILRPDDGTKAQPFYLDVLGSFEKKSFIMGIPYYSTFVMTDLEATREMVASLRATGIENIQTRYLGWFNDGINHDVARDIDVISKIGGKTGLRAISDAFESQGDAFYPDVAFLKVPYNSDRYKSTFESVRYIAGVTVLDASPHLATLRKFSRYTDSLMQVVNPLAVINHVDGFVKDYNKLGLDNLSLRDLGAYIASDKKRKRPIDRQWSMDILINQLEKLKDAAGDLMVVEGNSYSLAYADHIIDLPIGANPFYIIDEEVPFYQMVLHGYIDYAGSAFNLQTRYNKEEAILKMIEYGSSPHFLLTDKGSSELKKTSMEGYYSTQVGDWIDDAGEIYIEVASVLNQVRGKSMLKHEEIMDDFYKITYDGGRVIYVNYTSSNVTMEGVYVPARGYSIKGGDES